ncbi:hypothetical protein C8R44DRAFT_708389 [Mycena epipterygia]|nr:hypothetical protein C8R44DRAFT_708389 [Mycena epipterygia]
MAEAMALIGLIASVLQLVDTVTKAGTLVKDLHNAPKEQQQLLLEITSLQPLLAALQDRLLSNSSAAAMHIREPLSAFEDTMKRYSSKFQTGSKVSKSISWTLWNKKEAKEDLDQVERFKSLLHTWLTVDIWDVSQQHKTTLKSVEKSVESAELAAQRQQQQIDDAKRERILEWMSPLNSFQRQADILSKWLPGTGGWLLASPEFRNWESGSGTTLWCCGMPGAGKTVLVSLVVHHLESQSRNKNIGVACIYLNYKEAELQTPQNLLGCLWRQLVVGRPIPPAVHTLYDNHRERNTRLPLDEVCTILASSVTPYSKVYLIVDAVDEYPEEQRTVLLGALGAIGVNVMLTSRPHIDPDSTTLPNLQLVQIQATENDMQQYINTQISKSSRLSKHIQRQPELCEEIRSKILLNDNGMFLLAKLHIDSLTTKNTIKAVREALHQLPTDLCHTYDEAMDRIDHQGNDDKQLAHLTLTWVLNTKRPLAVGELQEALAIEPDATDLDPDNLLDISTILSVCAGLVIVDETASIVRLIHYTAQEYLDSIQSQRFPDAQTKITSSILTYLSFQKFTTLPTDWDDWEEQEKLVVQHPFLAYSQYSLHATSSNGQESVVHLLLEHGADVNIVSREHGTALQAASSQGHEAVVRLLLDHGANVNTVGGSCGTALQAASSKGHEVVVQLLILHGANVNMVTALSEKYITATALQAASYGGHKAVVQLLLDCGADVNITGGVIGSVLHAASWRGNQTLVQLLLAHGADVNTPGGEYGTPLQLASYRGHEAVVRLLIQNGANVNAQGGMYGTALEGAQVEDHKLVVKLLLKNGANSSVPLDVEGRGGHM